MKTLLNNIFADPWAIFILLFGTGIWIVALLVIFKSTKFQPKWVWVVVTLVSSTFYPVSAPPGTSFSLGVSVGSFYVLWFWLYGKNSPFDRWFKKS